MKLKISLFLLLANTSAMAASETASLWVDAKANSVKKFCAATAYLPFADSEQVCLKGARANLRFYVKRLNQIDAQLSPSPATAQRLIQQLATRVQKQFQMAGLDFSSELGADEILQSLKTSEIALQKGQISAVKKNLIQAKKLLNQLNHKL